MSSSASAPSAPGNSLALHWAQYLSLYAFNHDSNTAERKVGPVEVPFPGTSAGFHGRFSPDRYPIAPWGGSASSRR